MDDATLKQTVQDFLNKHRKAVFATVDAEGKPSTSLMLYVIDDSLKVYFGTRRSFKKYAQILANPNVALSVIEENIDPKTVVDIRGVARELSHDECEKHLAYFKSKNTSKYYIEGADDYVMFCITPVAIRWLDATSGELSITHLMS